mgnify:FL=1|jgi:hypothetical protein
MFAFTAVNSFSILPYQFTTEQFKIAGEAENNSPLGFAACLSKNSKFKTPNSDGIPSDTIFAFLMLNTMS